MRKPNKHLRLSYYYKNLFGRSDKHTTYRYYLNCMNYDKGIKGQVMRFIWKHKDYNCSKFNEMVRNKRFHNRMKAFKLIYRIGLIK
jgi:hypothetical protein